MPEPKGPGGPLPIFGRSVNPIPTGGGQIIPIYYYCPPPQIFLPSGITVTSYLVLPIKYPKGPGAILICNALYVENEIWLGVHFFVSSTMHSGYTY